VSLQKTNFTAPTGFDPANPTHVKKVLTALATRMGEESTDDAPGGGWRITGYDPETRRIYAARAAAIAETTHDTQRDEFTVRLPIDAKPSNGDKYAAELEDDRPGYYMTSYEPFLHKATLTRLTDDEARCRGAVAVALGVKPWDVKVKERADGGFDLGLPKTFVPSKHLDKLTEVAESVVGTEGWYAKVDAKSLRGALIPGTPPTFPAAIPYPLKDLRKAERDRVSLGWKLGKPGGPDNEVLWLDFDANPHTQVSGTSGSGKSVSLNAMIAGQVAAGAELAIIDLPHKAVDFYWCRDIVRPGGWGCDSLRHAVACITMLYKEGERRAKVIAQHEVTKWTELPEAEQFRPIFILIDEVTGLIQLDDVPKGLPKDHPLVTEAQEANLLRQTLLGYMKKIAAELRFVGLRLVLSSQVSSSTTGVPTSLRMNLGNKVLLGSRPTDNNRRLSLSDATSAPKVPEHVARDEKASRGVGVAEFEAQTPVVFKSFFATTDQYRKALLDLGVKTTDRWAPTAQEVARHTPSLDDGDPGPSRVPDSERSPVSGRPASEIAAEMGDDVSHLYGEDGQRLRGFEKANAARAAVVRGAKAKPTRTPDQNNPLQSGE